MGHLSDQATQDRSPENCIDVTSLADRPVFDAERFCRRFLQQGHNAFVGLRYQTSGNDWINLEMPIGPTLLDESGTVAEGAAITLVDMAATVAIWLRLGRWVPHATIDLRIDTPARAGPIPLLVGHARCHRIEDGIAFVEGRTTGPKGATIARFTASYMLLA